MPLEIVIVADDLTGAVDTATPFAQCGMAVAVALGPEHLDRAMATNPAVLAIATSTRHMSAVEAHARVLRTTDLLRQFAPRLYLKKIDSRLKGNVVPESLAMLQSLQRDRVVVIPAVPEQGRLQQNSYVTGMGIDEPIPVSTFPAGIDVRCPDIATQDDLTTVAMQVLADPAVLALGARGFGQALAVLLRNNAHCAVPAALEFPLLIAVGSRDPITISQIDHLRSGRADVMDMVAPNGNVPSLSRPDPVATLVRCVEASPGEDSAIVAVRFGEGITALMRRHPPLTLIASGGDTAAAVMSAAGVGVLNPIGEIGAGLPVCRFDINGRAVHLITKSGGFGGASTLSDVIGRMRYPD